MTSYWPPLRTLKIRKFGLDKMNTLSDFYFKMSCRTFQSTVQTDRQRQLDKLSAWCYRKSLLPDELKMYDGMMSNIKGLIEASNKTIEQLVIDSFNFKD